MIGQERLDQHAVTARPVTQEASATANTICSEEPIGVASVRAPAGPARAVREAHGTMGKPDQIFGIAA